MPAFVTAISTTAKTWTPPKFYAGMDGWIRNCGKYTTKH